MSYAHILMQRRTRKVPKNDETSHNYYTNSRPTINQYGNRFGSYLNDDSQNNYKNLDYRSSKPLNQKCQKNTRNNYFYKSFDSWRPQKNKPGNSFFNVVKQSLTCLWNRLSNFSNFDESLNFDKSIKTHRIKDYAFKKQSERLESTTFSDSEGEEEKDYFGYEQERRIPNFEGNRDLYDYDFKRGVKSLFNWSISKFEQSTQSLEYNNNKANWEDYDNGYHPPRKNYSVKTWGEYCDKAGKEEEMTRYLLDHENIHKVALVSRIILLLIQVIVTNFDAFPKHKNDGFKFEPELDYGTLLDRVISFLFGGFANWDGQYFLHISVYGYTQENMLAFFPLFPLTLYALAKPIHLFVGCFVSLSSIILVIGWFLNTFLFMKTSQIIYKIAKYMDTKSPTMRSTAVLLFCFNPASIFFSSLYTETLFVFLSSNVIYSLCKRESTMALFWASMSAICRSNGLLNFGFIIFYWMQETDLFSGDLIDIILLFQFMTKHSVLIVPFLGPFILFQHFGITKFCTTESNFVPDYCDYSILPYSYVQKEYWNVGFLRYFEMKQVPNFLLASPILYFVFTESFWRFRSKFAEVIIYRNLKHVFSLYISAFGIFISLFCLLNIHVQVSTRLILAAFPHIYIYLAESCCHDIFLFRTRQNSWPILSFSVYCWCLVYFIVGGIAFPLGFPWT